MYDDDDYQMSQIFTDEERKDLTLILAVVEQCNIYYQPSTEAWGLQGNYTCQNARKMLSRLMANGKARMQ